MQEQQVTNQKRYNPRTGSKPTYENYFRVDAKELNSGARVSKPFSSGPFRRTETLTIFQHDIPSEVLKLLDTDYQPFELEVDTETDGLEPRRDKLRLVTIKDAYQNVMLVRNPDHKSEGLINLLLVSDPYFHHAAFDLNFLLWWCGFRRNRIQEIFCNKVAYKAVFPERKSGLKSVVKDRLGIEMLKDKDVTVSNWDTPELSLEQIFYAVGDVYYLKRVRHTFSPRRLDPRLESIAAERANIELMGLDYTQTYGGEYNPKLRKMWLQREKELKL